jgi:ABC-type uncharacterized transport system fused permease/ATPase subunit
MKSGIKAYSNVLELIGNTPLIKLNRVTEHLEGNFYAKVEAFNPGHSTKDRIALYIIEEAEKLDYKENIKENRFWMRSLINAFINGSDPEEILNYEEKVNAMTPKEIQAIAKKYVSKDKVVAILMPEE